MKCPKCDGEGVMRRRDTAPWLSWTPCPDCYGTGEVSCCGDLGLPEPELEPHCGSIAPRFTQ